MKLPSREVFIIDNRTGYFYPVHDIVLSLLKHWNDEFMKGIATWAEDPRDEPLFDVNNERDWQYAGERLAAEYGADVVIITDDIGDLINGFDKTKWSLD